MIQYKALRTSTPNKKLRTFLNNWQKNKDTQTLIGDHYRARPYIPIEVNGKMFMMCPDTGNKLEIPSNILNKFKNEKS